MICRQKTSPEKGECGFTLLEVMVSLSIIAIGLTVLLTSQSQSLSLANEAKFGTVASLLAQSKMAEIELLQTEDLYKDSGDFGEKFPGYYWEIEVNNALPSGIEEISDDLTQINLHVYFGEQRQYEYTLRLYRFTPKSTGSQMG